MEGPLCFVQQTKVQPALRCRVGIGQRCMFDEARRPCGGA